MKKVITTHGGKTVSPSICRYIMGEYYIKNEECFYLDGSWYRINSPNLYKDHETGKWLTKKKLAKDDKMKYLEGIVAIDKDKNPVIGYFTSNKKKNVKIFSSNIPAKIDYCLSEELCDKLKFTLYNGIYADKEHITYMMRESKFSLNNIKRNLPYRASEVLFEFLEEYNKFPEKISPRFDTPIFQDLKYTFGVEIETHNGVIPENKCYKLGLIPLRDGSINGIEYATIPLSGPEGVESIYNAYETVHKHCTVSKSNSVHLHLGGYPRTKEAIVALYTLLFQIQDELYTYFPSGYRNTASIKQRDYCSPLPLIRAGRGSYQVKLDARFESLYEWISGGETFQNFSLAEHPGDRSGNHKWQVLQRYKNVNLISLIFGSRGTVEFRIHNPTIDPNKIVNWLLICSAILKYAEEHTDELINSTLNSSKSLFDIIKSVYSKSVTNYLIGYLGWKSKEHAEEAKKNDIEGNKMLQDEYAGKFIPNIFDIE